MGCSGERIIKIGQYLGNVRTNLWSTVFAPFLFVCPHIRPILIDINNSCNKVSVKYFVFIVKLSCVIMLFILLYITGH